MKTFTTSSMLSKVPSLIRNPQSARSRRRQLFSARMRFEALEDRTLLSVGLATSYSGLDYNSSGGAVPPDTCGAAGPSSYVETVNQAVRIYSPKSNPTSTVTDSFLDFWFTQGNLPKVAPWSFSSDPIVVWDDLVQSFIIGDQDIDHINHVSAFDIAVSRSNNPGTLTPADWYFYQITTTESGYDADYPGNFGYNHDAFVFTLNMFPAGRGGIHAQVVSASIPGLVSGTLTAFKNDVSDSSLRPTVMHDSVANDPMWFVTESNGRSIRVYKMTNVLSNSATFTSTNLAVNRYSRSVYPRQPDGTVVTNNIDSRILKAAECTNHIVATQAISVSPNEDDARWYDIDVSSGTPTLHDQGNVSAGRNTYIYYPGIDINSSGKIGMSYIWSGTGAGQYMSMYVTGRTPRDPAGTMQTPVLVQAGQANYHDSTGSGRAGDLSGISVDSDGSFWAANEYANTEATANWGTAIANFSLSAAAPAIPISHVSQSESTSAGSGGTTALPTPMPGLQRLSAFVNPASGQQAGASNGGLEQLIEALVWDQVVYQKNRKSAAT
jgi:hypothetical protein